MVITVDESYRHKRDRTEQQLFAVVEQNTPDSIKTPLFPQDEPKAFTFQLDKELIARLNLWDWFRNYAKEAQVSTAGIRGPQNILYPWDTRFPINQIGIILATLGKSLVANETADGRLVEKLAGCEVRYNSQKYVEYIARIQAAQGIRTYVPKSFGTLPIWMASFLIFMLDLDGGEHVTSSHSVSTKNATKDLNNQGSQYLPEESMQFVNKIEEILTIAETDGYPIQFSAVSDAHIDFERLEELHDGVQLYVGYLKGGVATDANLKLIRETKPSIVVDCVGGCMYRPMRAIFERLGIANSVRWLHVEADPLYHNIGKLDRNPKTGETEFYDLGCDFSILDVVTSTDYATKLKSQPIGTIIEATDPDGDRLIVCEIEDASRSETLEQLGIDFLDLGDDRLLTIYTPNQAFLMLMDFYAKQLKTSGLWEDHPRFMIKTTPSALAWDQWGDANTVKVINVPVGFKEIAAIMKKIERQLADAPEAPVVVQDVYGKTISLGIQPRLIFAGEESGGMITGPEKLIQSQSGRTAIAMREKSAGESMVLVTALAAHCKRANISLSDYLAAVFAESQITAMYDVREDITYYNESEPNPEKLRAAKREGEAKRDKNDLFFLGIAIALRDGKIDVEHARAILSDALPSLDFSTLEDVRFVGDGSYLKFHDKCVEVRKSGTDAKTKAYASGSDKEVCRKFAKAFGEASGELTELYTEQIGQNYLGDVESRARQIYDAFQSGKKGELS
jgi:phosphomannomutase